MRTVVGYLIIASVLFLSLDGAADLVSEGHPHSSEISAQQMAGTCAAPTEQANEHTDLNEDHCEHCCHGHVSSLTADVRISATLPRATARHGLLAAIRILDGQAPPTPPPNA